MPLARVPYNATVTPPVHRGRPYATISAFNLDAKIGLLELRVLCEVLSLTFRAYHDMHDVINGASVR